MDIVTQIIFGGAALVMIGIFSWMLKEVISQGKTNVSINSMLKSIGENLIEIKDTLKKIEAIEKAQGEAIHKIEELEVHCITDNKRIKKL